MSQLLQDVRYGVRGLARTWGFTAVAVAMLALGIGATTTVFSIANVLLFRPLNGGAGTDSELVRLYSRNRAEGGYWRRFSYPNFQDLRARRDLFEHLAAETTEAVGVGEGEATRRVYAAFVSADYFPMLGVPMARGRAFTPADDEPGAPPVVVLSHGFWTSAGSDPELVGKTLNVNGRACTVVGITTENFTGARVLLAPPLWLPMSQLDGLPFLSSNGTSRRAALFDRGNHQLDVLGRLAPGVSLASAAAALQALSASMERTYPAENRNQSLVIRPHSRTSNDKNPGRADPFSTSVFFALAMTVALLLVASLNLANMLLARGGLRGQELAVRLALGAGRARVVRLLLVEAALISLAGGFAGVWIAFGASQLVASTLRSALPMFGVVFDATPDGRVLAATLGFCVAATLVFGLGPALAASRADVVASLKQRTGSGSGAGGRGGLMMRRALVVAQIALSLTLLTAGGLFLFGAVRASSANPGFTLGGGLVAKLDATLAGYDEPRTRAAVVRVIERLRATPGVLSASLAHTTPYGERNFDRDVQPAGAAPGSKALNAQYRVIGADYFRTLGVAILRGREFTRAEEFSPAPTHPVIVDTEFARKMWPGQDPIGRQVQWAEPAVGAPASVAYEVVGLVSSLRVKLFDRSPRAHIYVPAGDNFQPALFAHVRIGSSDPGAEAGMLRAVGAAIRAVDPKLPVVGLQTLTEVRDAGYEVRFVRLAARVFAVLGLIALVVAAVGLYAVRAFLVSRRTREFGIRFAIGATAGDVLRLVMSEGAGLIAVGLSVGLLLSAGVSRILSGWVYGVRAFEPGIFVATALLLTAAMSLACYVPARRAIKVPPAVSLRNE